MLGQLAPAEAKRDAIHVAIIPVIAVRVLRPGEVLGSGIVDPFLKQPVQPGERFYLCLHPGTVTSVRHDWDHPFFPREHND